MGNPTRRFLYLVPLVILIFLLSGCATTGLPSPKNLELINSGKRSVVLLRITCDIDGNPYKVFQSGLTADDPIGFGLGSFETGGKPWFIEPKFFSDQTRKDGWMYLVLEPGLYYLAVQPPYRYDSSFPTSHLWRLDIPPKVRFVYIGTLHLPSIGENLNFGNIRILSFIWDNSAIRNEEDTARKIAAEFLPELQPFKTMLIVKHEGPIILKTPN